MIVALIVCGFVVWVISVFVRADRERERESHVNRIAKEQKALSDEFKLNLIKQREIQKEQFRLAEEQAKQAKILAKHEEDIQKLSFRISKAEDDIAHFSAVLETLEKERESYQGELDRINAKLDAYSVNLNPDDIARGDNFMQYSSSEGVAEYMDAFYRAKNQKVTGKDIEKMEKRKTTLEGKLFTLDGKIYSAEQKVKKAKFEKYAAEQKLA